MFGFIDRGHTLRPSTKAKAVFQYEHLSQSIQSMGKMVDEAARSDTLSLEEEVDDVQSITDEKSRSSLPWDLRMMNPRHSTPRMSRVKQWKREHPLKNHVEGELSESPKASLDQSKSWN